MTDRSTTTERTGTAPRPTSAPDRPALRWRDDDDNIHESDPTDLTLDDLRRLRQWRPFHWFHNQKHFPGWYWSATTGDLVGYESRTELTRLILADFDKTTTWITSQPFELGYHDGVKNRRHVPDYLLIGGRGDVRIVNVKTASALEQPSVQQALAHAGNCFRELGWDHEVWTPDDPIRTTNIRFLAGYRRSMLFQPKLIDRVLALATGRSIAETRDITALDTRPELMTPVILHLLWTQQLRADLNTPLSLSTPIWTTP